METDREKHEMTDNELYARVWLFVFVLIALVIAGITINSLRQKEVDRKAIESGYTQIVDQGYVVWKKP